MTSALIITVAPNGARRTKADHPALPLAPDELAEEALRCRNAGAAMIHLHVRDAQGGHSLDLDLYKTAIAAIRAKAGDDLIIQATTESVGIYQPAQQIAAMDALMPEAFSVAVRELFGAPEDERAGASFLLHHAQRGALIQYIIYDLADLSHFDRLTARGIIPLRGASVIFPLGRYAAGQQSSPGDLLPFLAHWSQPMPWTVCAFGKQEAQCAIAAATLGGHVRVGFENNLFLPNGTIAQHNADLVAAVAQTAQKLGLSLASPTQARAIFRQAE